MTRALLSRLPRTAPDWSWYSCLGFALLNESQRLERRSLSDRGLGRRFFTALPELPTDRQAMLDGFVYTPDHLLAATPEQIEVIRAAMRRVLGSIIDDARERHVNAPTRREGKTQ